MKLQKQIMDMSMFEKKRINLQTFKEKLIEYTELSNYFTYWGYKINDSDMNDRIPNFIATGFLSIPFSIALLFIVNNYMLFLPAVALTLLADGAAIFCIRNLKFGILKNRYKKWKLLKNEIQNLTQDSDSVFSLLLQTELNLKNLQQKIVENEELKNLINNSIENIIEQLKEIFAHYDNSLESMNKLIEKFSEIQNYEQQILQTIETYKEKKLKNIKTDQLKNEYMEYKKTQGIIENTEDQELENKTIRDFKAIL